jgi:hypothetical protein
LADEVAEILKNVTVFDKPSDMVFEPGTYYAFHHYGQNDIKKYLNSLSQYSVQEDISTFRGVETLSEVTVDGTEYKLDGSIYGITNNLSAIQDSGQFTLAFYAHSYDWTKPFAGQLIGNYSSDGFGIFNQNTITPTLYIPTSGGCNVYNTDLKQINTITYTSPVIAFIRQSGISNYYAVHSDNVIRRYNASDTLIQQIPIDGVSRLTQISMRIYFTAVILNAVLYG